MKKLMVTFALLLCIGAWAQNSDSVREFQDSFTFFLRVAEMSCPKQLELKFPKATCYRHGYADFFDFKDAFMPYTREPGSRLEPWRFVLLQLGGEPVEVFQTTYHPRNSKQRMELTYIDGLLLLSTKDQRASP